RVSTNEDLTGGEYSNVYAIGDLMGLNRLPGLAQVAMQGGAHAAKLIAAKTDEESTANETEAFDYFDKGTMATISRGYAVVKMGKTEITGFIGWLAWLGLHVSYVTGFRNRLVTIINWFQNGFTRSRGNIEITKQQAYARNIINESKKQEVN
ncbi:MAG: NAD(P)/FAD-dependent oxidoreductase, partial [Corynebacterium casei]|nr:NAD(P)/FAD-dependent oxidoreductase [Corynebacterium casei]